MSEIAETKTIIRKKIPKILPFIDGKSENFGLSKHGEVLFPGASYNQQMVCLEMNGTSRWITGLNESAPELQKIQNEDLKNAKIKQIRERVSYIEQILLANDLKIEDVDFWSKVKMLRPDNHDFWAKQFLLVSNEPKFLDPENPSDLILISAIEAGGFPDIAPSLEDARVAQRKPKFFLDKEVETSSSKVGIKKIKNEAVVNLQNLAKDSKKLLYVAKVIDPKSYQYTPSTSSDVIYDFLDNYISGLAHERVAKRAAETFNKTCSMSMEDLRIKAYINDAIFYKFIETRADRKQYHRSSNMMLGGNLEEILMWLKDPVNDSTWKKLVEEVEKFWNN